MASEEKFSAQNVDLYLTTSFTRRVSQGRRAKNDIHGVTERSAFSWLRYYTSGFHGSVYKRGSYFLRKALRLGINTKYTEALALACAHLAARERGFSAISKAESKTLRKLARRLAYLLVQKGIASVVEPRMLFRKEIEKMSATYGLEVEFCWSVFLANERLLSRLTPSTAAGIVVSQLLASEGKVVPRELRKYIYYAKKRKIELDTTRYLNPELAESSC